MDRLSNFHQDIHKNLIDVLNLLQLPLEYFLMEVVLQKEAFLSTQFHLVKLGDLLKICDYWPLSLTTVLEKKNSSILLDILYSKTQVTHIPYFKHLPMTFLANCYFRYHKAKPSLILLKFDINVPFRTMKSFITTCFPHFPIILTKYKLF